MGQHPAEARSAFDDIICMRLRVIDKSDVPEKNYSDDDEHKSFSLVKEAAKLWNKCLLGESEQILPVKSTEVPKVGVLTVKKSRV